MSTLIRVAALYTCVLTCGADAGAAATDNYAYAFPVQTRGTGAAWQIELTADVYAAAASEDLRDVEVVNAAGEAVPSAFYRAPAAARTAEPTETVTVPQFVLPLPAGDRGTAAGNDSIRLQVERGADGKLRRIDANVGASAVAPGAAAADLLLDASALRAPFAALRLDWSDGGDATAQFAIDASDDLQQWRPLVARATVLHLTRDGNVLDRHEIALGGARSAYLRVHRLDDGPPLAALAARLRTILPSTPEHPGRQWLQAVVDGSDVHHVESSLPPGDGQRPVAWRYHLPASLAVEAIKLDLVDDNSLARVVVLSQRSAGAEPKPWNPRAAFVAFRLRQGDALIGNDEIGAAVAAPARDWRVEFTTPLEHAPTLEVAWRPDRFVFLAQGDGPYRLVAGSRQRHRDDYPVDAALASLRATQGREWQPPLATLGARATLQGERALVAPSHETPRDWKSWLLWAVLIGAAALIGGLALSLLKSRG